MRLVLGLTALLTACTPGEPPPGASSNPSASVPLDASVPLPVLRLDGGSGQTADGATGTGTGTSTGTAADAGTGTGADAGSGALALFATDGNLPQTEDRPDPADALTLARAKALFEAIVADDPKAAEVFFFPLDAYKQVKDSSNPESDWRGRLIANFARDIHELHRSRPNLQKARFAGLEVPESAAKWIKPGEEYNKLPYFRVFNSQLTYDTDDGVRKTIPLKSLISWRGHYFVVHLSSIK